MSEDRNEAGQFTPSTDGLFGAEGVAAAEGYTPMSGRPKDDEITFANEREAADVRTILRETEGDDPIEGLEYKSETGEKIDEMKTVTAAEAADDLTAYHNSKIESAARSVGAEFAAAVDKMRADAIKDNPKGLADHFGIDADVVDKVDRAEKGEDPDKPIAKPAAVGDDITGEAVDAIDGLDPETRKALKIPQVRQALEQQFAEADKAREHYAGSLQAGQQMLQATVAALAPQLQGMPLEHWPQAIQMLAQVDPVRAQLVSDTLTNWGALQQAQQQEQYHRAYAQAQEFQSFYKTETAKVVQQLGKDGAAVVEHFKPKVEPYLRSLGLGDAELAALAQDRTITTAAGQRVLLDAMRYQEIISAPKAVASRNLPPVQRPGTSSSPRAGDNSTKIAALEKQLSNATSNKALRIAAEIQGLKRRAS